METPMTFTLGSTYFGPDISTENFGRTKLKQDESTHKITSQDVRFLVFLGCPI